MSPSAAFVQSLRDEIEAGRTFGRHPLWLRLQAGELSRDALPLFAVQFFLQVREFPRAVSALHTRCPDPEQRIELAESLYEEETGRISGCGLPHPELFVRFGEAVGATRADMLDGVPLPTTAALIAWFRHSTHDLSFAAGTAAINLAAEGQVPGAFGELARSLERNYGLSRAQVAFWDIHDEADRDHSDVGNHIVVRSATSADQQDEVRLAMRESLATWWRFFDGIEQAIDAG